MGKFVMKEVKTGIKFNLKAGNGEVIATSEGYKSKASCLNGIASVKKNAPDADTVKAKHTHELADEVKGMLQEHLGE